ncbi:MAG TPA: hypothetical protein VFC68_07455, partial [Treponemataceae bacterium]|nr:hypothetical protein [Treponemataceae bacterium]
ILTLVFSISVFANDDKLPTQNDTESSKKIKKSALKLFSEIGEAASSIADVVVSTTEQAKEDLTKKQKAQIQKCIGTWSFALANESYVIKIKSNGEMQIIFHREDNRKITWSGTYKIDTLAIHFEIKELKTSHFFSSQKQEQNHTWIIWYSFKNMPENQIKITCSDFPPNSYNIAAAKVTVYTKE